MSFMEKSLMLQQLTNAMNSNRENRLREHRELEEFHKICKRNNRTMSEEIELKIKNTVKNHTTGNSQFKIDQWNDNLDMRAVPAFNSTKEEWSRYVKVTNLENFTALKEKHREKGFFLIEKI